MIGAVSGSYVATRHFEAPTTQTNTNAHNSRREDPDPYYEITYQAVPAASYSVRESCENAIKAKFAPRSVLLRLRESPRGGGAGTIAAYRYAFTAKGDWRAIDCIVDPARGILTLLQFA